MQKIQLFFKFVSERPEPRVNEQIVRVGSPTAGATYFVEIFGATPNFIPLLFKEGQGWLIKMRSYITNAREAHRPDCRRGL